MKNYYEILEVDKNASDEIIKLAYKSLVKKYHPDVQENMSENDAESKIKEINEAYDILSDPEKRFGYDQNLVKETVTIEEYNALLNENLNLKKQLGYQNSNYNPGASHNYSNPTHYTRHVDSNYSDNIENSNNENNTYSSKNIFSGLDDSIKTVIAVFITFLILFIIFKIPFIRDFFLDFLSNGYFLVLVFVFVGYIYFRGKK